MTKKGVDKEIPTLDNCRQEIDRCDREIVSLLNQRARMAAEIGKIKREEGKSVFAPEREKKVYDKVQSFNEGPLPESCLHAVYREIMSGCIALEAATRISYLGPPGTFTHQAALEKFGSSMNYLPAPEIRDVFLAVTRKHADYGIVPIENSTEGSVNATCDMLMETDLKICSEIFLEIRQNLLGNCDLNEVKLVVSHPNALAQCRNWLAANLPKVPLREVASTALAAERASRESGVAAIAGDAAAMLYDVRHIVSGIEDMAKNTTRFIVMAHEFGGPSGDDRTSIVFSLPHASGSLYNALMPFKANGINLTRIESRPSKRLNWEYAFFVDLEGHVEDSKVALTLDGIREIADEFVILGSYPRAAHLVKRPPTIERNG